MPRYSQLPIAMVLATFIGEAQANLADNFHPSLLAQAEGLPKEFHEHFFDVPLAVRVMLDRQVLGDAMVVLSRDERITLLDFTDTRESRIAQAERDQWQRVLQQGIALGACTSRCEGLIALITACKTPSCPCFPVRRSARPRTVVTMRCPIRAAPG
jgi:hypothetical protein